MIEEEMTRDELLDRLELKKKEPKKKEPRCWRRVVPIYSLLLPRNI